LLREADIDWLDRSAASLDEGNALGDEVVPFLAGAGALGLAVPRELGGQGGELTDAIEAIAEVASHSLATAFTLWGQRAFIEYLLQSPNAALRERWLQPLLAGRHAGATGLSNAMKYLSGIESLGVRASARPGSDGWLLDGAVPWCTNLRRGGFLVAVAVARESGGSPLIAMVSSDREGVTRSEDLDLIALRGSNTASIRIDKSPLSTADLIHEDGNVFLPRARPAFLGLQCGMSIGLARAALATADQLGAARVHVLEEPVRTLTQRLQATVNTLYAGLRDGRFITHALELFTLRLDLADIVQAAVQLELQASGGRGYHRDQPLSFARRWREAAFIPIVTPSVTQLQGELAKHAAKAAALASSAAPLTPVIDTPTSRSQPPLDELAGG